LSFVAIKIMLINGYVIINILLYVD